MLFFFFLAALSASAGWMIFWSVFGMLFSSRPPYLFTLPLMMGIVNEPRFGVLVVILTWFYLMFQGHVNIQNKAKIKAKLDASDHAVETIATSPIVYHQPAKPGA